MTPGERPVETVLAFDFGTRRVGVAVGNSLTGGARPLALIDAADTERRFRRIAALIDEWRPERLLVGRPLLEDGAEFATTARTDRFARQLEGRFRLPVARVDERFSTIEARAGLAGHEPDDAEAAAVILRQYFDEHRTA